MGKAAVKPSASPGRQFRHSPINNLQGLSNCSREPSTLFHQFNSISRMILYAQIILSCKKIAEKNAERLPQLCSLSMAQLSIFPILHMQGPAARLPVPGAATAHTRTGFEEEHAHQKCQAWTLVAGIPVSSRNLKQKIQYRLVHNAHIIL